MRRRHPRDLLLLAGVLYLSLWLPLAAIVYAPQPLRAVNAHNPRCDWLGQDRAAIAATELAAYFRHAGSLDFAFWSDKEKGHMTQVRGLYDRLALGAALACAFVLAGLVRRGARANGPLAGADPGGNHTHNAVRRAALASALLVGSLLLLLPVFGWFWREVLHTALFDDDSWQNGPLDVSFYLFPRQVFMLALGWIVALGAGLDLALWAALRRRPTLSDPWASRRSSPACRAA